MRTITNNAHLPNAIFNALSKDTYVGGGDTSATKLIAPPRIVALRKFHENEIEEDASDKIWSLLGNATHRILELAASEHIKAEQRLYIPIEGIHLSDGPMVWKLSGQPDAYDTTDFSISDYKVTSVWSVLFGEKPEWIAQVNLQAMLHRHAGDRVDKGSIIAIIRDWSKRKAAYEKDYPPVAIKVIPIPLWSQEEAMEYAKKRVKLHQKAQLDYIASGKDANVLPLCTEEERWYRGASWAVKRIHNKFGKVNKKADRLCKTKAEAEQWIIDNAANAPKGTSYIEPEERKGENIRCIDYCDVAKFCPFGQAIIKERAVIAAAGPLSFKSDED